MSVLVTPKYWGVDREAPKLASRQAEVSAQVARQRDEGLGYRSCDCQCCAVVRSPVAPGRGLCYACLRFGCKPEAERTFFGTYEQIQAKRRQWEAEYPRHYLALAGEWSEDPYPTPDEPLGRRRLRMRFLVRRR